MRNNLNPLIKKDQMILLLILAVLGIFTQFGAAYLLEAILSLMPSVKEGYEALIEPMLEGNEIVFVMVVLLAPVLEELIFRIGIMKIGEKFLPFYAANIIQALLFGIYHGNYVQGVYAFILGMMLGYVLHRTGLIYASIVVHMTINMTGVVMQDIPLFYEQSPLIPFIGITSIIIVFLILFSFSSKKES